MSGTHGQSGEHGTDNRWGPQGPAGEAAMVLSHFCDILLSHSQYHARQGLNALMS